MASRQNGVRTYVMIVEPDVNIGLNLTDWLAAHGYQAVLVRSVEEVIEELRGIRPQLVFVGGGHSEPGIQIEISEILRLIRTGCPGVPMITIADRTNDYLTQDNMFRQEVHRDLVKPVRGGSFKRP
jgi:DNA-binding response OmpR family regulator